MFRHNYDFDPSYGYPLDQLLRVGCPVGPEDFDAYWTKKYERALTFSPNPRLVSLPSKYPGWDAYALSYFSTDGIEIKGWCLLPQGQKVERACVVMHGYGGREGPDTHLRFPNTAFFFPCARGLGVSRHPVISKEPAWHVLHDIQDRDAYVHGGCVEDVWLAVSSVLQLFPEVAGRIGLLGVSFGGGIGSMALAFDPRIQRAHFNVPSFGNQPLRLGLKTTGSGASVQQMFLAIPEKVMWTLAYHDAATAARRIRQPVHFACARFDPMVAPPGQFAIYNVVSSKKELFVLQAGHYDYPDQAKEEAQLLQEINRFFDAL
jgi:Acetyl esterase (deacetylase)